MTESSKESSMKVKKKADLKVVLLGDADVGKTCLIHRYMEGVFVEMPNTIGAAFFLKQWRRSNIAIWDTAGEEKFSGLSGFYCRNANAAIVAFDLNDPKTFESISVRHSQLLESAAENCVIVIVGTKKDLMTNERRYVTSEVALAKAKEMNDYWNSHRHPSGQIPYFETSSKTGENVQRVFEFVFETLLGSNTLKRSDEKLDLEPKGPQRRRGCCEV